MMQRIYKTVALSALMMSFPVSAHAYSAEDIVNHSDLFFISGSNIVSKSTTEEQFWSEYERAVTSTFNACDATETGSIRFEQDSNGYSFYVSEEQINTLIAHQEFADQWVAATVPLIVPDGTDSQTAVLMIYRWILTNYAYNYSICDSSAASSQYQGAYPMMTATQNGGICASFSKLFCAMVEYVPFNDAQLTDYQTEHPSHIEVAIVNNADRSHEWNAITEPDGTRYYYDLSAEAMMNSLMQDRSIDTVIPYYYRLTTEQITRTNNHGNPDTFIFVS
jgi:transglutaminase/protease-like cytokinesis protein 3